MATGATPAAKKPPPRCRTVYAKGTDTSDPPHSVVAHVCDRVVVEFIIGTQGDSGVPDWNVSRRPVKKVLKFVSKKYGSTNDSETTAQDFLFRAQGRGKTTVKFAETLPDPSSGPLETFTLKVNVLRRRR